MPTLKPRVAVTLEPQTHAVIERLAVLQGRTRGAVIADLLDSVAPSLTRTVALLEAAAAAPDQVKQGLRKVVEDVHDELAQVAGDTTRQLDFLLGELGGGQEADPHVVTRGSGAQAQRGTTKAKPKAKPATTRVSGQKAASKDRGVKDARKKREI